MAKKRYINTKFWSDNYISDLDPIEKLLFIYFLTNPFTDICGVYEISLKQIALDTGIDKQEMLPKMIARFSRDGKIHYLDGWIYIKNFAKHQAVNDKVKIGIDRSMSDVPEQIKAKIKEIEIGYHSVSKPINNLNLNSNSNLNLNLNLYSETSSPKNEVNEVIKLFEFINPSYEKLFANKTQRSAAERLLKKWTLPQLKAITHQVLPVINSDKYSKGKSLTPLQLEDNMGHIKSYIDQQKVNQPTRISI